MVGSECPTRVTLEPAGADVFSAGSSKTSMWEPLASCRIRQCGSTPADTVPEIVSDWEAAGVERLGTPEGNEWLGTAEDDDTLDPPDGDDRLDPPEGEEDA